MCGVKRETDESDLTEWDDDWLEADIDEAEAKRRIAALRRSWPLIFLALIAGLGAGFVVSDRLPSSYQAVGIVEITTSASGTTTDTVTDLDLESRRQLAEAESLAEQVSRRLLPLAIESVSARIIPDTHMIEVAVTAETRIGAVAGAGAAIDEFVARSIELETAEIDFQLEVLAILRLEQIDDTFARYGLFLDPEIVDQPGSIAAAQRSMFHAGTRLFGSDQQIISLRSARALVDGDVSVVDRPINAERMGTREVLVIAGAGLAFALVAAALAVIRAAFDDRIRLLSDLDEIAGDIPTLAMAPKGRASATDEAFRFAVATLRSQAPSDIAHSITLVDARGETNTTDASANLAVACAKARLDTLAVDTTPGPSKLGKAFGRSELVSTTRAALHAVKVTADGPYRTGPQILAQRLPQMVTPLGRPGEAAPSLLAGPDALAGLDDLLPRDSLVRLEVRPAETFEALQEMTQTFDVVIVDCPPILDRAEGLAWSAASDATVIIVRMGASRRGELRRTLSTLEESHAQVVGLLITNVGRRSGYRDLQWDQPPPTNSDTAPAVERGPAETNGSLQQVSS